MDPLIRSRISDLDRITKLRKEKGSLVAIAAMQSNNFGRTPEILDLLRIMENEERNLLNTREEVVQLGVQNTNRLILYGNLAGFALAAFLGIATRLSITRPLGEFQRLATSVGEGDLTQKSVVLSPNQEIGVGIDNGL